MKGLFYISIFALLFPPSFATSEEIQKVVSDCKKSDVVDELFSVFWEWRNGEITKVKSEWVTEKVSVLEKLKQTYGVKGLFAFLDHTREDFETLGRYGTYSWWMGSGESERNTARISDIKDFLEPYKEKVGEDLKESDFLFNENKSPIERYILFYMSSLLTTEAFSALEYLEKAIKKIYGEGGWNTFKRKLDNGDETLLGVFSCSNAELDSKISAFVKNFECYKGENDISISQFGIIAEEISNWISSCKAEIKTIFQPHCKGTF